MNRGLPAAAALIVVTNAVVLLGVARNRAGGPVETIQLTERELMRGYHGREDTGVSVQFQWERFSFPYAELYSWFDQAKLESLGFDCAAVLRNPTRPPLARPAFIVFELNGPAWEHWLAEQQARNLGRNFGFDPSTRSRLFPIDAARTPASLIQKYTDHQKYLVVRGVVRLSVNNWDQKAGKPGSYHLEPQVSEVLPGSIHVPLPISSMLAGLSSPNAHYTITLGYGHRFEPWIIGQ